MSKALGRSDTLLVLYIATFLSQFSFGLGTFTVPIYAYELEASPFLIGLIGASAGITYTVTTMLFGLVSDRFSRRRLTSAALAISTVAYVLYILSEDIGLLIPIRLVEWTAAALFWPSMEALISDSSSPASLDSALTRFNVAWGLAMVIGPLIAGLLITWFSVKSPFYLSAATSLLASLLLALVAVRTQVQGGEERSTETIVTNSHQNSVFKALTTTFLLAFSTGAVMSLFPAYATVLGIPAYETGLIVLISGLTQTLVFAKVRGIESVFTESGLFIIGPVFFTLSTAMITFSSTSFLFAIAFAVLGFASGIAYSASLSLMLRGRSSKRGLATGLFEGMIGLGYLLGPLIGGILSEFDLRAPYVLTALTSVIVLTIQLFLRRGRRS